MLKWAQIFPLLTIKNFINENFLSIYIKLMLNQNLINLRLFCVLFTHNSFDLKTVLGIFTTTSLHFILKIQLYA